MAKPLVVEIRRTNDDVLPDVVTREEIAAELGAYFVVTPHTCAAEQEAPLTEQECDMLRYLWAESRGESSGQIGWLNKNGFLNHAAIRAAMREGK